MLGFTLELQIFMCDMQAQDELNESFIFIPDFKL